MSPHPAPTSDDEMDEPATDWLPPGDEPELGSATVPDWVPPRIPDFEGPEDDDH